MKVYSPSQTAEWMRCPMMRALRKEGWVSKWGAKRDLAATIGQAFAAGVGTYNNYRQSTSSLPPRGVNAERTRLAVSSVEVAQAVMHRRLEEMERLGFVLTSGDDDEIYMAAMDKRITKAVSEYVINDPMPDDWQIVDVEASLGEPAGNARPDLVIRNSTGLYMVDYKSKVQLLARYENKTKGDYANSHQMLHYGHFGKLHYNEDLAGYYIGLAIFEPKFRCEWLPYPYNGETLKTWAATTPSAWATMEREDNGESAPWMSNNHSDNFGDCPYKKACFEYHYDPALMVRDYLYIERVPEETPNADATES